MASTSPAQLTGGRLGDYVALRDRTLPRYQAETDLIAATLADRFARQGLALFTDADGTVPDPSQPYAGSAQIGLAGRLRVSAAVAADPGLLRDGTQAVAATMGGPTAFTPNPPGGPAGFTDLLDRVLDSALAPRRRRARRGRRSPAPGWARTAPSPRPSRRRRRSPAMPTASPSPNSATGPRRPPPGARRKACRPRWRPASPPPPASMWMPRWPAW